MQITMVKKRLANGDPCEKCAQTEEMLRRRSLWSRIDEVVWAVEGDEQSPGNVLAAQHGVKVAPFFVVRDEEGDEDVVTSGLKLIRQYFPDAPRVPAQGAAPAPVDVGALAREYADAEPEVVLRFALERWGERCPIAFGGGEEIVLIDMATRMSLPIRVITLDTGRLHADTHAYLDDVRRRYGVPIDVFMPDAAALTDFLRQRGTNSFLRDGHVECCAIRKIAPLARALARADAWVTGRRRDPSRPSRSDLELIAADPRHAGAAGPLVKLNPLAHWSDERLEQYVREHDVPMNPLYERGFTQVDCEPCTRPARPEDPAYTDRWWWETDGPRVSGLHTSGDGI